MAKETTKSGAPATPSGQGHRLLRPAVILALGVLLLTLIHGLLGNIEWSQVWDSLEHLAWWQLLVLVGGLMLRQFFNALPLSLFIEGCSPAKAVVNDQAAILMTTVAPPPSDVVMRLAMFSSWGISTSAGLAGTVMNTVSFYVVRFGAPMLGVLVMLIGGELVYAELLPALGSGAISAALLIVVWLSFRDPRFAASTGQYAGAAAHRIRSSVDPAAWSESVTAFRSSVVDGITRTLPCSILALVAMVVTDAALIVLSIRFVGISPGELSAFWVLTAFLVAYPLTLFPFSGIGLLDAVVIATLMAQAGDALEPSLVAAFIIWRVVTIGTPLLLGVASVSWWRMSCAARAMIDQ